MRDSEQALAQDELRRRNIDVSSDPRSYSEIAASLGIVIATGEIEIAGEESDA